MTAELHKSHVKIYGDKKIKVKFTSSILIRMFVKLMIWMFYIDFSDDYLPSTPALHFFLGNIQL